jgi:UDP-N-acetylglucosamine--N-acetylmuramyl-(pentapeptide) pyrophosphoryl-undecaprenol N-acetylglucosamine transferase
MKIVIVGGHMSPALAVIEKLKNEDIFYIGRKYVFEKDVAISLEYQEVIKLGIPFYSINAARLQRKFTIQTIPSLTKFPSGFFQSLKILKQIKPDVVLGFGGYVSLPVILAAFFLKIPTVIHEQTSEAGLANKIEAKFVNKTCISWETSRKYFPPNKTVLTGNPLGENILNTKPIKNNDELLQIYITGGSGGSHFINSLVENSLSNLLEKFVVIHQTGDAKKYNDFERLQTEKNKLADSIAKNYHLQKFYSPKDMAQNLANADLVVGRAGINTVTELIYFAKPAFLIPLPFAQKNEQLKNALFLKELGLGEVGIQKTLMPKEFISTIYKMCANLKMYQLQKEIKIENAAKKIVEVLKDVSTKKIA